MPKLKKITAEEARKLFQAPIQAREKKIKEKATKTIAMEAARKTITEIRSNNGKQYGIKNLRPIKPGEVRRKAIAISLEIFVKQYLNSSTSVRHFKQWADAKPGEAIPWAWKVIYGDDSYRGSVQRGQVNVLIQLLTGQPGQQLPPPAPLPAPPVIDINTDEPTNV